MPFFLYTSLYVYGVHKKRGAGLPSSQLYNKNCRAVCHAC